MPAPVPVAVLLDELDDMESVLGLHHLRYLTGLQLFERIRKGLYELIQRHLHFTALHGRTGVHGVHPRQQVETCSVDDTLPHVEQLFAHALLRLLAGGGITHYLGIYVLFRYNGQAVPVELPVKHLHLARCYLHLGDDVAAHRLRIVHLLIFALEILPYFIIRHAHFGFECRRRTSLLGHHRQTCLHLGTDRIEVYLHRIYQSLVIQQFLHQQSFERLVHRVAVRRVPLFAPLFDKYVAGLHQFGIFDGRIAYDSHHLIDGISFLG